jgi:hypothetical protein
VNRLIVSHINERHWIVEQDWRTKFCTVKAGFVSNGASVPRIFWWLEPPAGRLFEAAVLHDYMYSNAVRHKKWADLAFKRTCELHNVNRFKLKIYCKLIQWFGKGNYV